MKNIDLTNWTKAGEGFESDSYNNNKDENIMLKLFRPHILRTRIELSFNASNEYIKLGINTPKAYEMVECDGRIGIVYERIKNKISLYRMFVNDHSKAEEIATIFGKLLKDFHKRKVDIHKTSSRIDVLEKITYGMIQNADFILDDKKLELLTKIKTFYDKYKNEANEPTLCMGDCHIGNVVIANDKYYFIDLVDVLHATPLIDLAWVDSSVTNSDLIDMSIPENERIPINDKIKFVEKFHNIYFEGFDKNYIDDRLEKVKKYIDIQKLLLNIYISKNVDEIEKILNYI